VKIAAAHNGPLYLRLGKAGEPNLTAESPEPFVFGRVRMIRAGGDICILSYGPIMKLALEVASGLQAETSLSSAVFSVATLKPLDRKRIESLLRDFKIVIVIEEHVERGGLGSQVKQIAWDTGAPCKLCNFHLRDEFLHIYGTQDDLRRAHGLSAVEIVRTVADREISHG
jgi:transketolase